MLVTGGYESSALASVELLNLDGSFLCKLPSLPEGRSSHTQNGLVACGGNPIDTYREVTCDTFSIGMEEWKKSHDLKDERRSHSSWASPQGVVLLGGFGSSPSSETDGKNTEVLTNSGDTTPGFKLKFRTR